MTLTVTSSAAERFMQMINGDLLPRVEITAGGCNGFEKRFSMDRQHEDDIKIDLPNGAALLVDTVSLDMLAESTIDFKSGLAGSYFSIHIPEAASTCGCGTSFSL
jgi:iron-sulfur cluster insertion protein